MFNRNRITALMAALALIIAIPFSVQSKDAAQKEPAKKENPWVLKKDKDGIKVFIRNVEGIEFKEFLGVATVDFPIEKVDRLMNNVPNQVNWLCDTIESKVISADPVNPIQYNVITAPLVSNRDVVILTKVTRTPGKIMRTFRAIKHPSVPERKGIVRMPTMVGMWLFEAVGKNQTKVTYQNLADPGGSLPSGLVNMTVVKMPFVSLTNMREQLKSMK
jgi:hypothetical protein